MEQEYKYMVVTICMTYNHAPYIVDAMNGFAMQETTFPVYYLITDDASTDGEPEVIKQYLADHFQSPYRTEETDDYYLIYAVHKTNPNCNFIVFFLKYNHYSIKKSRLPYQAEWRDNAKYIAMCEGDDYWIYPRKIQEQVELLSQDDNIVVCGGGYKSCKNGIEFGRTCKYKAGNNYFEFSISEWSNEWLLKTLTVMYKREALTDYLERIEKYKYLRDIHLFYHLMKKGNGIYISRVLGIYNIHEGSTCSTVPKAENALYGYRCNKELYEVNVDEITRRRYLRSINSRLVDRMPGQDNFHLYKEGLNLIKNLNEFFSLTYHFITRKTM